MKKTGSKTENKAATFNIEVTRAHVYDDTRTFFDMIVNDVKVYGCTFIEGKKGDFVSFPSRKGTGKNGEETYFNYAYVNFSTDDVKNIRSQIEELI